MDNGQVTGYAQLDLPEVTAAGTPEAIDALLVAAEARATTTRLLLWSHGQRSAVAHIAEETAGNGAVFSWPRSAVLRQRVGIARAFALSPKVLLLDEPFGMLDSLTRYELQQVLLELWRKDRKTAVMVTHDVDEALFLSDRIVMMTTGPEAEVGDILSVPFTRPRERQAVMAHPDYYRLREHLISFLENHGTKKIPAAQQAPKTVEPLPKSEEPTELLLQ